MTCAEAKQPPWRAAPALRNSRPAGLLLALVLSACGAAETDPLTPTGARVASAMTPTTAPPYPLTFQLRNDTGSSLFMLESCGSYAP
jgi:hypothetical protein